MTFASPVYVAGLDLEFIPIGFWSTYTGVNVPFAAGISIEPHPTDSLRSRELTSTSSISVLFPEPDTPVTTVSLERGIFTSIFFRLWAWAPRTSIKSEGAPRPAPNPDLSREPKYLPLARILFTQSGGRSRVYDFPAGRARPRAHVYDPIGVAHGERVVFYEDDRASDSPRPGISFTTSVGCRPIVGSSSM